MNLNIETHINWNIKQLTLPTRSLDKTRENHLFCKYWGWHLTVDLSRPAGKPTLWTLRKVSNRISLSTPRRLNRIDNFRLLWNFCFRNHYSISLSLWDGMCRPRLACADCAGWPVSIHYAECIMLVFSWNGSYIVLDECPEHNDYASFLWHDVLTEIYKNKCS